VVMVMVVAMCDAALILSNTLNSHMVLQRAPAQAAVWGWSNPKDSVNVNFNNKDYSATADTTGLWQVSLAATAAGGPYVITITTATEKIVLEDVLFGDVWVCSGQSNMEFSVSGAFNASTEFLIANNYPNIRLFSVGHSNVSLTPLDQLLPGQLYTWAPVTNITVRGFSAVCWFAGRDLYDAVQVPLGLISSNWGGTYIQAWSSPDALAACNITKDTFVELAENESLEKSILKGVNPNQYSVLWNAMIAPFLRSPIAGALWYQGEQNTGQPLTYGCMEKAMISDWRKKFGQQFEFPFFFVQLAPVNSSSAQQNWPDTRQQQLAGLELPAVGFATAVDLGDPFSPAGSIHPRYKQAVGDRLSRSMRNIAYGQNINWQGPTLKSLAIAPGANFSIVVEFDIYESSGLVQGNAPIGYVGCPSNGTGVCTGWEIQLSDTKWYPSTDSAVVDTRHVQVNFNVPEGLNATTLSYAYSVWPLCTLFNTEGLPAIPFSTKLPSSF